MQGWIVRSLFADSPRREVDHPKSTEEPVGLDRERHIFRVLRDRRRPAAPPSGSNPPACSGQLEPILAEPGLAQDVGGVLGLQYGGSRLKVARRAAASRTRTIPASTGTYSHLCGPRATLSAKAMAASSDR